MFKIQTDRTKAMTYGPRLNQVGARLEAPMHHELMDTLGVMDDTNLRVKLRFITLQEVSNGHDDVLPEQDPQDHHDRINLPGNLKECNPIKGRSADFIITDGPSVPTGPSILAPTRETIEGADIAAEDYIQLDLT